MNTTNTTQQQRIIVEKTWDWHYYSENNSKQNSTSQSKPLRLLLAQYSGSKRSYLDMLQETSRVNKAYCKLHGSCDYVQLVGVGIVNHESLFNFSERHSSFNKIVVLEKALQLNDKYDALLILDADCIMWDLSYDVTRLLRRSNNTMLVAHRVNKTQPVHTYNINNGVTLWNLQHPKTPVVAQKWKEKAFIWLGEQIDNGDQEILHRVLWQQNATDYVYSIIDEFSYREGTVVRHYIRQQLSWIHVSANERLQEVQEAASYVCRTYSPACERI
jgi:hypothetical protein